MLRNVEGTRYATSIDVEKALEQPESEPFYLAPNDVVYVPRTKIYELNQWVTQHIEEVIPDTALLATYNWGRGTIGYSNR